MLMKMISKLSYSEKEKDVPHQERTKQQRETLSPAFHVICDVIAGAWGKKF